LLSERANRAARYPVLVRLDVGDVVVYASHGIGRVRARQKRVVLGAEVEMVVLELADGLTVTLPIERAQEQLRPLASKSDMRRVQETLREAHVLSADPWLKRRNGALSKLTDGDPVGLAELVRDSACRVRALSAKGTTSQLSPGEHELSEKARQLLSAEIARARGLGPAEADAWIDEQLTQAG
jgi:CarD family transcriptional regulator